MDKRTLEVLEFQKIRGMLVKLARTPMGAECCARLAPLQDPAKVERLQGETAEVRRMLDAGLRLPLEGVREIRSSIWWAASGSTLTALQLHEIQQTLSAAREIERLLLGWQEPARYVVDLAARIGEFPELEQELDRLLAPDGSLSDGASPDLQHIRDELCAARTRAAGRAEAILRDAGISSQPEARHLAVWNGRCVLRVPPELQALIPGVVHPSSGRTGVLVEPFEVAPLNNEVARLTGAEETASNQALASVSQMVGGLFSGLRQTADILGEIDYAAARAALGSAMRAITPGLNGSGQLVIRQGRHPLLTGRVVPLDVHLGQEFDVLVVTGPNTGGKTVTLKTVGLFCLMAQAGLQVPAAEGTELPVFTQVFADIGDEQSIEQNLSTFSGHIARIAEILRQANASSLVLLDELGSGTDPAEGAALATAILESLHGRGARVIATTHFGDVKEFASSRPRVENASIAFDLTTLRSTYRLVVGVPGTSQALAVAERLGLPAEVVGQARRSLEQK